MFLLLGGMPVTQNRTGGTEMKTVLLAALLLTLAQQSTSISQSARQESSGFTNGFINGRTWNDLSNAAKITYIYGIVDGANLFQVRMDEQPGLKPFDAAIWKAKETLLTKAATGEVQEQMDAFYADSANARIPMTTDMNTA